MRAGTPRTGPSVTAKDLSEKVGAPNRATAIVLLAGFFIFSCPGTAGAVVDRGDKIPAVRAPHPMPLDTTLSDPAWQTGVVATDFFNYTTRAEAKVKTTAFLLFDDDNLYVAFRCEQAGFPIIATQTTNDVGLGLDDTVTIAIDPQGNGSRGYYYYVTPRGVRYQQSTESAVYKPAWQAAAKTDGTTWTVMMIIPLKNLRGSPGSWRINFVRHLSSLEEDLTWAYDRQMGGWQDSTFWPTVTGLDFKASSGRPRPYANVFGLASAGANRNSFPQLNGTAGPSHAPHLGVDGAVPFNDTLAFIGTLNPDYSNVEADQQTITPQQFQRALNEYRPFFAQGAAYLNPVAQFSINGPINQPFYTPSIGQFNAGAKVEGTAGLNAIGALAAFGPGFNDEAYGFNHRTADQASRFWFNGVEAHHTNNGSSVTPCPFVGAAQLTTCTDSLFNFGGRVSSLKTGAESVFEYGSEWGQYVPDAAKGHSLLVLENVNRANYSAGAGYRDLGPYFNPVDGFTLINDIRGPAAYGNFNGNGKPGAPLKNYNFGFGAERYLDQSGEVHYSEYSWFVNLTFKNLLTFNTGPLDSQIRQYTLGYPVYLGGQDFSSHTNFFGLFYRDGTPQSIDTGWSYGPNAGFLAPGGVQQSFYSSFYFNEFFATGKMQVTPKLNAVASYTGDRERCYFTGCDIQQLLRRFGLGYSMGPNATLTFAYRTISGTGYSPTATNFATTYHRKFGNGNEMYLEWGTPQTTTQLDRFIFKYVLHIGGGTGT